MQMLRDHQARDVGRWTTASRICMMARLSYDRVSSQHVTVNAEPIPGRLSITFCGLKDAVICGVRRNVPNRLQMT